MKTLNADLIIEKNQLYSEQPWIVLFEIELDVEPYLRLAAYPESLTWNSNRWTAFPAYIDKISEESTGSLDGIMVYVSNIDLMVSAYLENVDVIGKTVTIYIVHREHLDITDDILSFSYRINRVTMTAETAAFELGHDDLFSIDLPNQRYIRDKCRFALRDARCNYPNDEFGALSDQDLRIGGDTEKGGGWSTLNAANSDSLRIIDGYLKIEVSAGGPFRWLDSTRSGPYAYKELPFDFDVNTHYASGPAGDPTPAGGIFLLQDSVTVSSWIGIEGRIESGKRRTVIKSTQLGTTAELYNQMAHPYIRVTRVGPAFTVYGHYEAFSEEWEQLATFRRSDLGNKMRVGFAAYTLNSSGAPYAQMWSYFRCSSGGMPTCDYSLDGPNGCRVHQNTLNFGGFPSLPYGRLYGI